MPQAGSTITLSDIVRLITTVVNYILIISGIVIVGVIVYAGIVMATSDANGARFKNGKAMLTNAVWGALVVFGVGIIVATISSVAQSPTNIIR